MNSLPSRMQAVRHSRFGGPEVLETVELPLPEPGRGQALLRVEAAGVNLADALLREDRYAFTPALPRVPGSEVVGHVVALGPQTDGPAPGTRVAALLFADGRHDGGYAGYVVCALDWLVPLPATIDAASALALLAQGLTALHLTRQAPPAGRSVLVTAAAGGVGSLLVQLARLAGARQVIAAASRVARLDPALVAGADATLEYGAPDWPARLAALTGGHGPELVYESTGGAVTQACLAALAPNGRLVVYGAPNLHDFRLGPDGLAGLIFGNRSLGGFLLLPLLTPAGVRADLAALFAQFERGELRVGIAGIWPLAAAADAHRALAERRDSGKHVLLPAAAGA